MFMFLTRNKQFEFAINCDINDIHIVSLYEFDVLKYQRLFYQISH